MEVAGMVGEADRCYLLTGYFQTALLHSRLQDENGSTYNNVSHTEPEEGRHS